MTHTLHREGSIEELQQDFVVLAIPCRGITTEGSKPKLQRFLTLAQKYNPINTGDSKQGNQYMMKGPQNIIAGMKDGGVCHVVYNNPEAVYSLLRDLKEEDLGLSVTVSGLMETADKCCKEAGLQRHSVNMSLGIFGKTEKLAADDVREVATMCGHGMVTGNLVLEMVEKIKKGGISLEKAGEKLAATCLCGIFNTDRAARLLKRMAEK